jgi:hypothetical protein
MKQIPILDRILAKPETVQVVIKALMVKASISAGRDKGGREWSDADLELYGGTALRQWNQVVSKCRKFDSSVNESHLAETVVDGMRKQQVWGKILRGNAQ